MGRAQDSDAVWKDFAPKTRAAEFFHVLSCVGDDDVKAVQPVRVRLQGFVNVVQRDDKSIPAAAKRGYDVSHVVC